MESVVEVGRLALFEPVVAGDRRVHVEDGDLLSLRLLLLDDVGQVGVVRLDARVVRRGLAPHERGGDHVGGRLELVEAVEELRRAPHVGERVGAGVVRAEVEEDDVRRLEHAAPGGQHLVDALPVAAVAVVDLPPAVALVVDVHASHRTRRGGIRPHVVHVVTRRKEFRPERASVAGCVL